MKSIEFIFAEFGQRQNNGKLNFKSPRLDPTYSSIKKYFPEAKITVYSDQTDLKEIYPEINLIYVDTDKNVLFDKSHHYWGWFYCDCYKIYGSLHSHADIAIPCDSDLMFINDQVKTIIPITQRFGVCVPTNERQLVKVDAIHTRGNNGDYHIGEDESLGNLLTYDLWWTSFDTKNDRARKYLEEVYNQMIVKHPYKRAPLHMTRASWETGIYPYSMPIQWGVGSGHIGCKNEIILHLGHTNVQDYYLEERISK